MKLDITPNEHSLKSLHTPVRASFDTLREGSLQAPTIVSDNGTVVHSPQKRKVSKPGLVVTEAAAKRRCQDRTLSSNDLNESFLQNVLWSARCNGVYTKYKGDRHAREQESTQPIEGQSDSQPSSLPPSPVVLGSTTSDDAAIPERGGLHQEVILHNYHELVDRRLFKDAGLIISPVSDGERRAYESIFMEDSDEWSPSAKELS